MEQGNGTVSAVIPVRDPDPYRLAWSLDSLSRQTAPVGEAVIVDGSETPVEADVEGIESRVVHEPDRGISACRSVGNRAARGEYIIQMDEDAVLLSENYVEDALSRLSEDDVSAAGGVVYPIRGNALGRGIALADRFNPSDLGTHYLVHPSEPGETPEAYPMEDRGEDLTVREVLRQDGEIERMDNQAALKDLPTTRQSVARDFILTTVGGAIAGAASSAIESALADRVSFFS